MGVEKKRITVTIGEEMYNKLKEKADVMGSTVPAILLVYASQSIQQEEAITSMGSIMAKLGNIEQLQAIIEQKKDGL